MAGVVVAVTVMRVLLFVWEVRMLRECGGRSRCDSGECGV